MAFSTQYLKNPKIKRLIENILGELYPFLEDQADCIHELTSIGQALGEHENISRLLDKILILARRFANADGGTLYLVDNARKELVFHVVHNDTLQIDYDAKTARQKDIPNVQLYLSDGSKNLSNVSSYVFHTGKTVNIEDVYSTEEFHFGGTRAFDKELNYRSKSMLVIPMKNHEDTIIGVLQLINALDPKTKEILPFDEDAARKASALATQASVMITQQNLIREMEELFEAFIRAIAVSIDEKSRHTGGHIQRVTDLTLMIAECINKDETVFKHTFLSPDEIKELRMAALMHDTGKITTPDHIVNKSSRLEAVFDRIELVNTRLQVLKLEKELATARKKIAALESKGSLEEGDEKDSDERQLFDIAQTAAFLQKINGSGSRVSKDDVSRIEPLLSRTIDILGTQYPLLTPDEFENLSIPFGTLTVMERDQINQHAALSAKILDKLPWPKKLAQVPYIAGSHHEKLDGSGYPNGLKSDELNLQARILAIADIFEALSAKDRPYKSPMTLAQAFEILEDMARKNHIDPDIVDVFKKSDAPLDYAKKYLHSSQFG